MTSAIPPTPFLTGSPGRALRFPIQIDDAEHPEFFHHRPLDHGKSTLADRNSSAAVGSPTAG